MNNNVTFSWTNDFNKFNLNDMESGEIRLYKPAGILCIKTSNDDFSIVGGSYSFQDASWEEICFVCASGLAKKYYRIGDKKLLTLQNASGKPQEFYVRLIAFDHDDLTTNVETYNRGTGKAAVTLEIISLVDNDMRFANFPSNLANLPVWWGNSYIRSTTNKLIDVFPRILQDNIKEVTKKSAQYIAPTRSDLNNTKSWKVETTNDKIFIPSATELNINNFTTEGNPYQYYLESTDAYKYYYVDSSGKAIDYDFGTRSLSIYGTGSFRESSQYYYYPYYYRYCNVSTSNCGDAGLTNKYYPRCLFCI